MPKGYSLRELYDAFFYENNIKIKNYIEVYELESIGLAIERGEGISFIPESIYNKNSIKPHFPLINTKDVIIDNLDFFKPLFLTCKSTNSVKKNYEKYFKFFEEVGKIINKLHRYPEYNEHPN